MSILFNEEIVDKIDFLLRHNIALWDENKKSKCINSKVVKGDSKIFVC